MSTMQLINPEEPKTQQHDVVSVPYGLLGFERVKNYTLLAKADEEPFLRFQMLDDARHAFLVVPSELVSPDYQPDLEDEDVDFLELEDPSDALCLNIVSLKGARKATVNLKGPVVINRRTLVAKQVIPKNADQYSVRHPLPFS